MPANSGGSDLDHPRDALTSTRIKSVQKLCLPCGNSLPRRLCHQLQVESGNTLVLCAHQCKRDSISSLRNTLSMTSHAGQPATPAMCHSLPLSPRPPCGVFCGWALLAKPSFDREAFDGVPLRDLAGKMRHPSYFPPVSDVHCFTRTGPRRSTEIRRVFYRQVRRSQISIGPPISELVVQNFAFFRSHHICVSILAMVFKANQSRLEISGRVLVLSLANASNI